MHTLFFDASIVAFHAGQRVAGWAQRHASFASMLGAAALALVPSTALAAVDTEVSSLVVKMVNWGCGILGTLSVWSVARAGYAFQGEDAHDAIPRLKRNIIGLVITFGSIGIVQFIKSAFTQQRL